jgi:RNA polymerase sigma-70 factor (ECF subfamily)
MMDVFGCDTTEWIRSAPGLPPGAGYEYHQPPTEAMMPDSGPAATPNTLETTLDLLARVRQGDGEALERLYARCLPPLRRWARGRLPSAARGALDTQDLVQETILSSLRHLQHFESRHEGALQAYLRQAVLNRVRDEARRTGRRPAVTELTDSQPSGDASPLDIAIGRQGVERYEAALRRLRPADREAIIGRLELQHDYQALATILGKPSANAARVAVTRALARLVEQFDEA